MADGFSLIAYWNSFSDIDKGTIIVAIGVALMTLAVIGGLLYEEAIKKKPQEPEDFYSTPTPRISKAKVKGSRRTPPKKRGKIGWV